MIDSRLCPSKDDLVTYLYAEGEDGAQRAVEAHLEGCAACRTELDALSDVRASLTAWRAPELAGHVHVFPARTTSGSWWQPLARPLVPLAAAATIVLGVAAGLANLDIRYGDDGLVIRTGWSQPAGATAAVVTAPAVSPRPASTATPDDKAWRAELASLETRLRRDLAPVPVVADVRQDRQDRSETPSLSPEVLRQVQSLIDASEVRQQRNLALRMTELSRDFDGQRKADMVQIQQGLGFLEGRSAAERREMMNYLLRVSSQQGQRPQ